MLSALVAVAGAAVGVWVMQSGGGDKSTAPASPPPRAEVARQPEAPASRRTAPASPGQSESSPVTDEVPAATPTQAAFSEHAGRASVWWSRSIPILEQADPPVFAALAQQFSSRMSAVTPQTSAPIRQELINEERQLIEALRQRYEGVPPLMRLLDDLDADLQRVQDQVVEVGPSPDPRERSARVGDGLDHP